MWCTDRLPKLGRVADRYPPPTNGCVVRSRLHKEQAFVGCAELPMDSHVWCRMLQRIHSDASRPGPAQRGSHKQPERSVQPPLAKLPRGQRPKNVP